ncbi:MAG: cupin domain-containing protein [candidate division Zixibacteria bacterium]|nr:cupin domain-containing protein [candidate division Zixibacteria bacterium]
MRHKHMVTVILSALAFVAFLAIVTLGGEEKGAKDNAHRDHIMIGGADISWSEGPISLPAGAKYSIMEGDPSQPGLFTMRITVPANYKVPAHWHPADEHVTVIAGSFSMGLGEKFDQSALKELKVGGFAVMPTGVRHFAWSKDGATIQLHGMGPWGINYVNSDDDPRLAKKSTK